MLFGVYLAKVVALPLTIGLLVGYRALSRDRRCPVCGGDTVQIVSVLARLSRRIWRDSSLQRRWCTNCEWVGFARLHRAPLAPAFPSGTGVRMSARGCRTEPLRTLQFGGTEWRVLVQCWQEQERTLGRLLFVGPAGRFWRDATDPFAGATRSDVVQQALGLSDGLLTYRLKSVVTD